MRPRGAFKKSVLTRYHLILVCILSFNLLIPKSIFADTNAILTDIKLANTRDELLTYFKVENAFTPKTTQAVQNGIPTTFSFYVSLYKTTSNLFDKKIAEAFARQ